MFKKSILFGFICFVSVQLCYADKKLVLGYSQIGAESDWRIANTKSIKDAAKDASIQLLFSDAQQQQANQLKAIKSFILQKVDVIALSPVVTTGWKDVLTDAKKAKIPVIILDREIDGITPDLYTTYIGSDFLEEGKRAAKCMLEQMAPIDPKRKYNIVELRGTEGSAPAISRAKGFREFLKNQPQFKIVRSENGDFKENLGKEWMEKILKESKGSKIDVLYAHNDNMALGAIPAIEAAGQKPGKDIKIISVDAIKGAFTAMIDGKINCTVECSPLLGPQLMSLAKKIASGESVPKRVVTQESVFPQSSAAKEIKSRTY